MSWSPDNKPNMNVERGVVISKTAAELLFDNWGNRVNPDGSLWNLDGKLAARNGNE